MSLFIVLVLFPEVKSVSSAVAIIEEVWPNQIQAVKVETDGTDVCLALIDCEHTGAGGGVSWKKDQTMEHQIDE